jgi:calcium-dependent protein kinase
METLGKHEQEELVTTKPTKKPGATRKAPELGDETEEQENKKKEKKKKAKKKKKKDEDRKKKKKGKDSDDDESDKEEEKKDKNRDKGDIIENKFVMLMEMGKGAFGQIFLTYFNDGKEGLEVATKKELKKIGKSSTPQLKMEFIVYKTLLHIATPTVGSQDLHFNFTGKDLIPQEDVQGVPKFYGFGETNDYFYLIISLLGPNLVELFNFCNCRKFTVSTVCMIAIQMLNRIEYFHKHHYLHRDIKPENFLIGCAENSNIIHLIDFGLCKKYKDPKTHQHIPYREGRLLTGTARYVSINTHLGIEQSRRDDLESIGYVLVFFLKGSLPWQGLKTNIDKYNKIMEKKLQIPTEILCYGLPDEMAYYLNYCKSLRFEDRPDYDYLRGLFVKLLYSCMGTYSLTKEHLKFDWCYEDPNTIWMMYNKKRPPPITHNKIEEEVEEITPITHANEFEKKPTTGSVGNKLNLLKINTGKGGFLSKLDEENDSSDGSPIPKSNENNPYFYNSQIEPSENQQSSITSEKTVALDVVGQPQKIGLNMNNQNVEVQEHKEEIDDYVDRLLTKKAKLNSVNSLKKEKEEGKVPSSNIKEKSYNIQIEKLTSLSNNKNEELSDNTIEVKTNNKNFNNISQYINDYSESNDSNNAIIQSSIKKNEEKAKKNKSNTKLEKVVEVEKFEKNNEPKPPAKPIDYKHYEVKYTFKNLENYESKREDSAKKNEISVEAQILKKKKTEKADNQKSPVKSKESMGPPKDLKLTVNNSTNKELMTVKSFDSTALKTTEQKERRKSKMSEMAPQEMKFSKDQLIKISTEPIQNYYTIMGDLGHGSYGSVKRVKHKQLGEDRAMKIVKKKSESSHNEIEILKKISHPNIISIYEIFEDSKNYYIMTEFLEGGELFEMITSQGFFSEVDAAKIIKQILNAVNYMHNKNIVHRDLKPENILLINKSGKDIRDNNYDIKLIDFGTAKSFERNQKLTKFIGTSYYIAPEVLAESYDEKCDVWSCGVIFYILLCGYPPFNGASNVDIYHAIKFSSPNFSGDEWKAVNKDAIDLIKQMLNKNPMKRFSAEMCMNHKWFRIIEDESQNKKNSKKGINHEQNSIKAISKMKDFVAQNKLKQAVLQYISTQFNFKEEEENMRDLFNQFDTHKKGSINSVEFTALLVKMFGEIDGRNIAQSIFQSLDLDGSGEISYNEFITALIDDRNLVTQDRMRKAFNMIDKDGSGKITIDEIKHIFGGDETKWKKIVGEVDLNGDGEIDFEEFKIMMKGLEQGDLI